MIQEVYDESKKKMESCVSFFKKELGRLRTGRASTSLLENITVEFYGTQTPVGQTANLSVADGNTIVIQPWDQSVIGDIEKAIMASDLGLTPMNDGRQIRVPLPPLTEERRKELAKIVKKESEECKVAIRNVRRENMEMVKSLEKSKEISQDEQKKAQEEIQKITDSYIKRADELAAGKEKEILEF